MAVDKLVVLKAIEDKFKGKSLTKNFKENLATKWAEKIEDESGIDAYIEDREDVILEANSEADRRAIAAAKKAKEEKVNPEIPPKEEEVDPNDTNALLKQLLAKQTALDEKIANFEAGNKAKSIKEKFESDPRVKDIPDFIRNGYIPTSEDDFEDKVTSLADSYKGFAEKHKLQDLGNDTPPNGTGGTKVSPKQISAEEAAKIVANMN